MRQRDSLVKDNSAVAGFFLDIPVLLILILIIFSSLTFFYLNFERRDTGEEERLASECLRVKNEIQTHPKFISEYDTEKFDLEKIQAIENLEEHIDLRDQFDYRVRFSIEERDLEVSLGTAIVEEDNPRRVDSYNVPVNVVDDSGNTALALLEVKVWR